MAFLRSHVLQVVRECQSLSENLNDFKTMVFFSFYYSLGIPCVDKSG
jgi:hypothetical protein